jgi:hypothetical protein
MELALTLVSGVAWTVVYVEAVRLGFRDRTYAIPVAALALNFAWEVIYAVRGVAEGLSPQAAVNVAWALADVVVVVTFVRFGRAELPRFVPRALFLAAAAALLAVAFAVQLLFLDEFGPFAAPRYAAFLQNLLMSGLFIAMFVARGGTRGQSVLLAGAKWIGTLAPTYLFGRLEGDGSAFILGLGALCAVLDGAYLGMVWLAGRHPAVLGGASDLAAVLTAPPPGPRPQRAAGPARRARPRTRG